MKEGFKRPAHRDFMTSAELKADKFTGIRHNNLIDEQELWVEGEVKLSVSMDKMRRDPDFWTKQYEQIFDLKHAEMNDNLIVRNK